MVQKFEDTDSFEVKYGGGIQPVLSMTLEDATNGIGRCKIGKDEEW